MYRIVVQKFCGAAAGVGAIFVVMGQAPLSLLPFVAVAFVLLTD